MSGIIAQNSGRHTGLVKASSGGGGAWNLILTQTASSSATIDFTSGIDGTYDEYIFKCIGIHRETNSAEFGFQANAAGESGYNETITSCAFDGYHAEDDSYLVFQYNGGEDQTQGTGLQHLVENSFNADDSADAGYLHLFNPSSTTFVTNFMARFTYMHANQGIRDTYIAGYINTTSAIDEVQFKMSTGNIDAGTISLYGIS
jgi:hypothetical protein